VTIQPVSQPMSPLRRRMLEDMATRGLRQDTQRDYIRFVRSFAAFLRRPPDTATPEDIRRFQVHQAESGVQPQSINCSVSALRFFFTVTLDRPDLSRRFILVRYPRKLPTVLSVEAAALVAGGQAARRDAARGLVVSRAELPRTYFDTPDQPGCP
jgi:integrase/recombinase XerD